MATWGHGASQIQFGINAPRPKREEYMKEIKGNIWDYRRDGNWIVIPTNYITKKNGQAVMGKGLAYQASLRYPQLAEKLGRWIGLYPEHPQLFLFPEERLVAFPTKKHWRDKSDLLLIEEMSLIMGTMQFGGFFVYLPRLGCGNGGLRWETVKPLIDHLNDRFIVVDDGSGGE